MCYKTKDKLAISETHLGFFFINPKLFFCVFKCKIYKTLWKILKSNISIHTKSTNCIFILNYKKPNHISILFTSFTNPYQMLSVL